MRVIQCTTRVDMAAADFWALRMDQNFDAFCARFDNTDMEVLSRREEQSNGQTLQVIECLYRVERRLAGLDPKVWQYALDDIRESIAELRFYRERFFDV